MFRLSAFGSTAVYSTEHDGLRCVEVCPTSMLVFCGLGECAGMHPKYLVHISQNKLNSFLKGVDFTSSLSSVQVLLKCSSHVEIVKYGGLRILSLLLADDVVLLVYQAITYGLHWSGWQQNNKQLWWKIFKFETQFKTKVEAVQASDDDASWAPHRWGVSNSLSPWDQSRPRTCWRDVREVA